MAQPKMAQSLAAGFDDPVTQSQSAFRAAMRALATPGVVIPYLSALLPEQPFEPNAAALGLALLDFEVRFYLAPSLSANPAFVDFLRFHTGSRLVENPAEAEFAFLDCGADALILSEFAQGIPDYPDRSTTIIAQCASFTAGAPLTITGPGIKREGALRVSPLPTDFTAQWTQNRAGFPLGVDLIFVSSDGFVGLPRSSRILAGGM